MRYIRTALTAIACMVATSTGAFAASSSVTLTVHNVDVYTVLQMLAMQSGKNIVPDNTSVKHDKITLSIRNVPFDLALHTVEMSDNLQDYRANNVIYIGTTDAMNRFSPNAGDGSITHNYRLQYADATTLAASLTSALPTGTVIVGDARSHSVVVTGSPTVVSRANQIVSALDVPLVAGSASLQSKTFHLRYMKSTDALAQLRGAIQATAGSSMIDASGTNSIVVTGTPDMVATAGAILFNLDQYAPQVLFEVRVVDVQPINDNTNFGILFSGAAIGTTTTTQPSNGQFITTYKVGTTLQVNATLNAMISTGHGQTLADPKIAVLNNHEGDLLIGENYPISYVNAQTNALQFQFVPIGVQLKLTPTIADNGDITTELHPQFSALIGLGAQGLPIVAQRQVDTDLRVHDGQSIVLAGLLQDIVSNQTTKIPWLSDIPVFGGLFRDKVTDHTRDEVVFVITPHIVQDGTLAPAADLPKLKP